jgi:hypothetical protein
MRLCARPRVRIFGRRIAMEANVVSAIFYLILDFYVAFWMVADKTDVIYIFHWVYLSFLCDYIISQNE